MAELHPNALNAMRGFQAFAAGDMATMKELFHDDAVWHVGGRNRWSGDYEGLDAILGFFGDIAEEASISQDVHAILGDDDHVVALINSTATRGDKTLESHLIFTFHSRDGKVSEVWGTSLDDYATDEFWA